MSFALVLKKTSWYRRRYSRPIRVKTQICCFSNFTCKYSRNHSTAIVFILCVAYLTLSDDGWIINQDFCAD